ncbi:hypothetical protein HORIV_35420 [Vreelandella olivaria]|uniref:Uncharacterized protein n=1 Tax=Vreelandella olivaria TaxID=390919 RepID=A0ABM7GGI4_9GAMM|nr:hypothetical protein HORIV_35420 [Halomonas olivaria]
MLNSDPLNSRALGSPMPPEGGIDCVPIIKRLPGSVLNSSPLGSWALNGSGGTIVIGCDDGPQGALFDPLERVEVYLLLIGELRVPMSSFQATMRRTGKSFLQAIVPAGDSVLPALEYGALMQVQLGYYYPSADEYDGLETIALAPLEQIRSDEGPTRFTLTLSGYGDFRKPIPENAHCRAYRPGRSIKAPGVCAVTSICCYGLTTTRLIPTVRVSAWGRSSIL